MEINALLNELNSAASTMQNSFCIVNGAVMDLDEIQKMGIQEFSLRAKINMPLKLYKYFPNLSDHATGVNYSLQALKNNTVFMQSPSNFDDVYDSDISLDYLQYEKLRLMEYWLNSEVIAKKRGKSCVYFRKEHGFLRLDVAFTSEQKLQLT